MHRGLQVGDGGEDLRPVLADLLLAAEAARWVRRGLVAIVEREATGQGVEVVGVGGLHEAFDDGGGIGGLAHGWRTSFQF